MRLLQQRPVPRCRLGDQPVSATHGAAALSADARFARSVYVWVLIALFVHFFITTYLAGGGKKGKKAAAKKAE
jgi:hypothetical protein